MAERRAIHIEWRSDGEAQHDGSADLGEGRKGNKRYLDVEVVVRPVDVRGNNGGEVAAVLLLVTPRHDVNHALGVRVAWASKKRARDTERRKGASLVMEQLSHGEMIMSIVQQPPCTIKFTFVGGVRGSVMDHGFVDGVGGLVGEDAGGEAGDQLLHFEVLAGLHHVVVDQHVLAVELDFLGHVAKEAPHQGCQMHHTGRSVLLEDSVGLSFVPEVSVLGAEKNVAFRLLCNGVYREACEGVEMKWGRSVTQRDGPQHEPSARSSSHSRKVDNIPL